MVPSLGKNNELFLRAQGVEHLDKATKASS